MPRQPRLDAPDTRPHVMVRGIERTAIFQDDTDRADFVARLTALAEHGALAVYAWALLPHHAHLLLRAGRRPPPQHAEPPHRLRRGLQPPPPPGGPPLPEPVSLHRGGGGALPPGTRPLPAPPPGAAPPLRTLERFPWTGHSALVGTIPRPWQDTATILAQFGPPCGLPQGRRPDP